MPPPAVSKKIARCGMIMFGQFSLLSCDKLVFVVFMFCLVYVKRESQHSTVVVTWRVCREAKTQNLR
jgi:hypothetical protein